MKICLTRDVVDSGRKLARGQIGRSVMRTSVYTWLVEFKYPDFAYPCKGKRVYAELNSKDFQTFDEATHQDR